MKYFSDGIHQPLNGIDHSHEDQDQSLNGIDHSHEDQDRDQQHGVLPMVLDVSQCPQLPNFRGKYLISTLNSPDCPLMEYDEALNFCMQRNLKSISVKETLSISAKEEILSIANKVIPGFWTNGFIKNPIQNIVYWNEIGENIIPDLWAEGQPDGPIGGPVSRMEFCVAVQMTGQTGKLHDKLCNSKMVAVCEKNSMIPNLDFGVFSLQSL